MTLLEEFKMETTNTPKDPSTFDLPTLVQWYIDLRQYKSDLKRSIEPSLAQADEQMELIEKEFNKRLTESDTKSMKTANGTISRTQKTKYLLTDSFTFRQWLIKNPEVGAQLVQGISQGEVRAFLEDGGELPEGVSADHFFDISVRRA